MHRIDLNCDLGELEGDDGLALDAAVLAHVSSANVACGAHAGNAIRIRQLAVLCRQHGVAFGAHPGYPDRTGFGRTVIPMSPLEITNSVAAQIALAAGIADSEGIRVSHVKAHGALYNLAATDSAVAEAIAAGVRRACADARLVGLSGSKLIAAGKALGLATTNEVFADRNYCADGTLMPRDQPHAILRDAHEIAQRIVEVVRTGRVRIRAGLEIPVVAETVCVHGDTENCLEIVIRLRAVLEENRILVCRPEVHLSVTE